MVTLFVLETEFFQIILKYEGKHEIKLETATDHFIVYILFTFSYLRLACVAGSILWGRARWT